MANYERHAADYPALEIRKAFVEAYLHAAAQQEGGGYAARDGGDPPPNAVPALLYAADAYSLASHLQWAAWCTVQAALSKIEYDFAGCAQNLLACHEARRHTAYPAGF